MARARCRALLTDDHRRLQQVGHLAGLPAQHLPQDEHGPLAGRQVLQGGDEGEADRVARRRQLGRVGLGTERLGVGQRADPRGLGEPGRERRVGGGRRAEVHRPGPPLGAAEHVEAHVRGDAVEPRPQGRAALEAVEGPPGPHHRLLHRVLGLEAGPEHPVAVGGQLPAVGLEVVLGQRVAPPIAAGFGDRVGRCGHLGAA